MKRLMVTCLVVSFFIRLAVGEPVSEKQAAQVGEAFLHYKSQQKPQPVQGAMKLVSTGIESAWYLYSYDNAWVLLSGDTDMYPVLGYSLEGALEPEEINPAMQSYLTAREKQAKSIRSNKLQSEKNRLAWQMYAEGNYAKGNNREVAPMIDTKWGQSWPYNAACPSHPNGPGGHVVVGCVATAMGQIMNYYEYPESGQYTHTTYWGDEIEIDLSAVEYDWDVMGTTINVASREAISTLLFHCGVAVDMNYSANGSSSSVSSAEYALKYHFKYKSGSDFVEKTNYSDVDWKNLLMEDLEKDHPILYRGVSDNGSGHAFVCDGYQDTCHFHFNWGWNGYNDGYFYLDGMDFYWNQGAAINIMPYWGEYCNCMIYNQASWTFDDGSGPNYAWNNTDCTWLIQPDSAESIKLTFLQFDTEENDVLNVYDGNSTDAPLIGAYSGSSIPPEIISSGNALAFHFITDSDVQSKGWKVKYESIVLDKPDFAAEAFQLYPNPATDQVFLFVPGKEPVDVSVFSTTGVRVMHQTLSAGRNVLDVSQLSGGLYVVNIKGASHNLMRKVEVKE
ncbi:MAG: C10 family peptidase [Bacteroidota bacterium]|nr:C10 family peptidase [Bacteroidota bacterium]